MMTEGEHNEKVSGLNELIGQIREALDSGDTDAAKSVLDQLESAMQEEETAEEGSFEGGEEEGGYSESEGEEMPMKKNMGRPKPSDVLGEFLGK